MVLVYLKKKNAAVPLNVGPKSMCVLPLATPRSVLSQRVHVISCQRTTLCVSSPTGVWSEVNHAGEFQPTESSAAAAAAAAGFLQTHVLEPQRVLQSTGRGRWRDRPSKVSAKKKKPEKLLAANRLRKLNTHQGTKGVRGKDPLHTTVSHG